MILDLDKFIAKEQPVWDELERIVEEKEEGKEKTAMPLERANRFLYLYQRASSDLVRLKTFAGEADTAFYLENLIARAYRQLHMRRKRENTFRPLSWFLVSLPCTFRRHGKAFALSTALFLFGALLGALVLGLDYDQKRNLIPEQFDHLYGDPSERVAKEEAAQFDNFDSRQTFSTYLMTHNTKVAIFTAASGFLWGILTMILLFYNGIIIGVVCFDYLQAGEGVFLTAWLLPHGSFELPAIFMGGQAGLMIGRAVIGWGSDLRMTERFRLIRNDLLTILGGAAVLLIWAGLVESFLSQYHKPDFYPWKIALGLFQLVLLFAFLGYGGKRTPSRAKERKEMLPALSSPSSQGHH